MTKANPRPVKPGRPQVHIPDIVEDDGPPIPTERRVQAFSGWIKGNHASNAANDAKGNEQTLPEISVSGGLVGADIAINDTVLALHDSMSTFLQKAQALNELFEEGGKVLDRIEREQRALMAEYLPGGKGK